MGQVAALAKLHGVIDLAILLSAADVVDEVRVLELGQRLQFLDELDALGFAVQKFRIEHLDGDKLLDLLARDAVRAEGLKRFAKTSLSEQPRPVFPRPGDFIFPVLALGSPD